MFVDGFIALCPTITGASCTEPGLAAYGRQPVSFGRSVNGTSSLATPYCFGGGMFGPCAGRAIFDAPTGGNLLLLLPFATPRNIAIPYDMGDAGAIRLQFTPLGIYPNGDAWSGTFAAGAVVGQTYDDQSFLVPPYIQGAGGHSTPNVALSPITAGVALTVTRGVLRAS